MGNDLESKDLGEFLLDLKTTLSSHEERITGTEEAIETIGKRLIGSNPSSPTTCCFS